MDLNQLMFAPPSAVTGTPQSDSSDFYLGSSASTAALAASLASREPRDSNQELILPVPLTDTQKELINCLLTLHRRTLVQSLSPLSTNSADSPSADPLDDTTLGSLEQRMASIDSGNDSPELFHERLHKLDILDLLDHGLRSIATHPYLFVDHYMPKNLLLKEPPEMLAKPSGKFLAYRDLLLQAQKYPLNVAVVARGIKELDLIEAFTLGKAVNIKRYTGASLFQKTGNPVHSTLHSTSSGLNLVSASSSGSSRHAGRRKAAGRGGRGRRTAGGTPSSDVLDSESRNETRNAGRRTGRTEPEEPPGEFPCTVHLLSVSQFTTSFTPEVRFDLAVAFDTYFDARDVAPPLVRRNSRGLPVPVVRLVPVGSVDHGLLSVGGGTRLEARQEAILSSIVALGRGGCGPNEAQVGAESMMAQFGKWCGSLRGAVVAWEPKLPPLPSGSAAELEAMVAQGGRLVASPLFSETEPATKRVKTEDSAALPTSLKEYKVGITRAVARRVAEIRQADRRGELDDLRQAETVRQAEIDSVYEQMERLYSVWKRLEEDVAVAEDVSERKTAELMRLQEEEREVAALVAGIAEAEEAQARKAEAGDSSAEKSTEKPQAGANSDANSDTENVTEAGKTETPKESADSADSTGVSSTNSLSAPASASDSASTLSTLTAAAERQVQQYTEEISVLQKALDDISAGNDRLRRKYQTATAEAAAKSLQVSELTKHLDELRKENIELPYQLRLLGWKEEKDAKDREKIALAGQIKLLEAHLETASIVLKEKLQNQSGRTSRARDRDRDRERSTTPYKAVRRTKSRSESPGSV